MDYVKKWTFFHITINQDGVNLRLNRNPIKGTSQNRKNNKNIDFPIDKTQKLPHIIYEP